MPNNLQDLFDSGLERDPLHISQAALLLAFHFEYSDPMSNMRWEAIAVQNAHLARAHQTQAPFENTTLMANRIRDLKRLWWCCILTDRILALGVRLPVSITLDLFDPASADYLEFHEVWDNDSQYYHPATRVVLYEALIGACRFASLLTPRALSTDWSPESIGPNVCVENRKMFSRELLSQLYSCRDSHLQLLYSQEAGWDLAVAVNLHLMSLTYMYVLFIRENKNHLG